MSGKAQSIKDERTALEKLNSGLLVLNFKREMEESAYSVIGRVTFGHLVVQKRQSYASEIERVLGEIELTAFLLSEIEFDTTKEISNKIKQPEEIIGFYNGVFLGLVHQAKDKLLRLIDYMAADDKIKKEYREADKVKIGKHEELLKEIGILELVSEWKQDSGSIAVILKKRTNHHHFISKNSLNSDFQNIRFSRTMLSSPGVSSLNEVGKEYMMNLGKESFEKYRNDIVSKQNTSIELIKNNLNSIAEKLISHYKIPVDYEPQSKFGAEYTDYLSSLDIKNETSLDKIPPDGIMTIESIKKLNDDIKGEVISIYGVGSYFRGDFIPGTSDINILMITENFEKIFDYNGYPVTLYAIPEHKFLSDEYKKEQFLCWSDGVLIDGKQYEWKQKDFPKPGTLLSMLLNEGALTKMKSLKEEVLNLENPTRIELRLIELRAIRIQIDHLFGIAMSNKPFYVASRLKKIEYIKEVFGIQPLTLTLEQIYIQRGLVVGQVNFGEMVDAFIASQEKNYEKIKKISDNITGSKV